MATQELRKMCTDPSEYVPPVLLDTPEAFLTSLTNGYTADATDRAMTSLRAMIAADSVLASTMGGFHDKELSPLRDALDGDQDEKRSQLNDGLVGDQDGKLSPLRDALDGDQDEKRSQLNDGLVGDQDGKLSPLKDGLVGDQDEERSRLKSVCTVDTDSRASKLCHATSPHVQNFHLDNECMPLSDVSYRSSVETWVLRRSSAGKLQEALFRLLALNTVTVEESHWKFILKALTLSGVDPVTLETAVDVISSHYLDRTTK
jgi:hypothetical protein